jgi:hypothetical protein
MKQEHLLAQDIKEGYRRLVREKEQLQARCEQLELDIERWHKRILDADLIRRGLQHFERLVGLLPVADQKQFFRLLLQEVAVWPVEPERQLPQEALPAGAANGAGVRALTRRSRRGQSFPVARPRWTRPDR